MKKFEYTYDRGHELRDLSDYSDQGWELVSVVKTIRTPTVVFYFKREINEIKDKTPLLIWLSQNETKIRSYGLVGKKILNTNYELRREGPDGYYIEEMTENSFRQLNGMGTKCWVVFKEIRGY